MKSRIRNNDTCLCLFPQDTAFLLSSRLYSAVKRCSSEELKFSFQRSCSVKGLAEETSEILIRSEVVGVTKVANNKNDLVKGSLTRQKQQNSKVYVKSPEFSPALGLIIVGKKSVATNLR